MGSHTHVYTLQMDYNSSFILLRCVQCHTTEKPILETYTGLKGYSAMPRQPSLANNTPAAQ